MKEVVQTISQTNVLLQVFVEESPERYEKVQEDLSHVFAALQFKDILKSEVGHAGTILMEMRLTLDDMIAQGLKVRDIVKPPPRDCLNR